MNTEFPLFSTMALYEEQLQLISTGKSLSVPKNVFFYVYLPQCRKASVNTSVVRGEGLK